MSAPEAVAIVVNHDGAGFVREAVASLLAQEGCRVEVVVVDNASRDGSDLALEREFGKRIRLLRASRNLGFGGGNNLAIRDSDAAWVVLLNSDAVAAPDLVQRSLDAAASDDRIGMVAPKVLGIERPDEIDTVGHLLALDGLNRGRGRGERDEGQYDECSEALFPSGAAALYRRRMLDEVGLFDEALFLYGDDADLGLRARLAGWRCALAPGAVARHHYSRSTGAYSSLKAYHVERNRILLLLKLYPLRFILASPLHSLHRMLLQVWGAWSGRGAAARLAGDRSFWHLVSLTLRAWAGALRLAPHALRERCRFRPLRRLRTREFGRLLRRYRLSAAEAALKE
jgi:GT2 family glycosyltransferase